MTPICAYCSNRNTILLFTRHIVNNSEDGALRGGDINLELSHCWSFPEGSRLLVSALRCDARDVLCKAIYVSNSHLRRVKSKPESPLIADGTKNSLFDTFLSIELHFQLFLRLLKALELFYVASFVVRYETSFL